MGLLINLELYNILGVAAVWDSYNLVLTKGENKMTGYYWTSFDSIWNHFDKALNNWDLIVSQPKTKLSHMPSYPHSDVWMGEDGKELCMRFALAGYLKDNVKVTAAGNKLRVTAKCENGSKERYVHHGISSKDVDFTLNIDENFDPMKSKVKFENGMLTVEIPVSKKGRVVDLL